MSAIRFSCKACGRPIKVDAQYVGRNGECPQCKTKFVVPAPSDDHPPMPPLPMPQAVAKPIGNQTPPTQESLPTVPGSAEAFTSNQPTPVIHYASRPDPATTTVAATSGLVNALPPRLEKALLETLGPGENVHVKLKGAWKEGLVCTDTRVVIVKGGAFTGQMFGTNTFQIPYTQIAGVEVKFGFATGYFELSAGGMQNTRKSYWSTDARWDPSKAPNCVSLNSRSQAKVFREACTFILSKIDQLRSGPPNTSQIAPSGGQDGSGGAVAALEKLGELCNKGVISKEEFEAKKRELLSRI